MKISVIIPAYNNEGYIARCIESVKAQTHTDFECIVVDDCSHDATINKALQARGDDTRFKVLGLARNGGPSVARNEGIKLADSDALFFLDADDWIEPTILSRLAELAEQHPNCGRIFMPPIVDYEDGSPSRRWIVEMEGGYTPDSPLPFKSPSFDLGHCTGGLYVLHNLPPELSFPEGVPVFEDMIFNMGLIFAGTRLFVAQEPLYHYIRRRGSVVSTHRYTGDEDARANAALSALSLKYHAPEEMYLRFRNFLNRAIMGRLAH